jgi:hypothetical protein
MKQNRNRTARIGETQEVIELIEPSAAFQLNGSVEGIGKALENLSPEAIGEIMDAIALYVSKNKC